jgi:hypothetical protein
VKGVGFYRVVSCNTKASKGIKSSPNVFGIGHKNIYIYWTIFPLDLVDLYAFNQDPTIPPPPNSDKWDPNPYTILVV